LTANELGLTHKFQTRIVLYVMIYDGLVTKFHKKYIDELKI